MIPWWDPELLKRAWCLFEIYCSAGKEIELQIALPPDQVAKFKENLLQEGPEGMNKMLATVDVERAEAFLAEDREAILDLVRRRPGGSNGINKVWQT
jgi:hypothetical protein